MVAPQALFPNAKRTKKAKAPRPASTQAANLLFATFVLFAFKNAAPAARSKSDYETSA